MEDFYPILQGYNLHSMQSRRLLSNWTVDLWMIRITAHLLYIE